MIRFTWLYMRLRGRLFVNGIKSAFRRDGMELLSKTAALLVVAILFLLFLGLAVLLAALGYLAGRAVGAGSEDTDAILFAARILLLIAIGLVVVLSLFGAGGASIAGHNRLRLLPVPREAFHRIEVVASLADPWIACLAPAFLLFAAGLAIEQRSGPLVLALAAATALLALLACLRTFLTLLLGWFLRSRRRAEVFLLAAVLGVSALSAIVPAMTANLGSADRRTAPWSIAELDRELPVWSRALPSELYGRSIGMALAGHQGAAWLAAALLCVEAAALYGLSSLAHRRVMSSVESGGGGRRRERAELRAGRLIYGLTPAASAVAWVQVRTALRTVRGRLIVLMPGPFLATMGLLARRAPGELPGGSLLGSDGHVLFGVGIVFSLYALQALSTNQFGSDRTGLSRHFLAPLSDLDLVLGKAVGCGLVAACAVLLCLVTSLVVAPGGSPLVWLAVLLGGSATYVALTPACTLLSAALPVASDLSKTGSGGNPHSLSMLIGTLLVLVFAAPPAAILAVAHRRFERPGLALLLMAIWTMLTVALAIPLLRFAARAVATRRENLALVAAGR
ncbi:MAG TPA: hypothetical protein VE078_07445 [Thermoanaerobaculia bacterium]|nr:hypothetical protein [Thermoanaerobaculia bacterium]